MINDDNPYLGYDDQSITILSTSSTSFIAKLHPIPDDILKKCKLCIIMMIMMMMMIMML